ncbi:hypothetical protein RI845_08640 [Thalassotalea nanhaiensis]|uniref:Nucleotide-diphospho-sugar transferase domain-containing protein n=1 Tax=Thalassotalea nanhaiensis TaxID=3065648 RepID=A0ABY9TMX0_9GAMM|nr:hypothetical protein RI845_08640 [Colwelliaceae bacterium SQ345]
MMSQIQNSQTPPQKTLVFSIALNGYQWLYQEYLLSHQAYAKTNNYEYVVISKPSISNLGMECCWLKLVLLKAALVNGYQNVMFVDADALINEDCPSIDEIFVDDKYLYMANGYTGRFNSGVMIAKKAGALINWLDKLILSRRQHLPSIDSTGWGENGHIIHFSKQVNFIKVLHHRWNNTFDEKLNDHIRHFSYGPMRTSKLKTLAHHVLRRSLGLLVKYVFVKQGVNHILASDVFQRETQKVIVNYPQFQSSHKP